MNNNLVDRFIAIAEGRSGIIFKAVEFIIM
jgi:hypothetical protein